MCQSSLPTIALLFRVACLFTLTENASRTHRTHRSRCFREIPKALRRYNAHELFVIEEGEAEVSRDGEVVRTLAAGDVSARSA